jgi:hypothetical protein
MRHGVPERHEHRVLPGLAKPLDQRVAPENPALLQRRLLRFRIEEPKLALGRADAALRDLQVSRGKLDTD